MRSFVLTLIAFSMATALHAQKLTPLPPEEEAAAIKKWQETGKNPLPKPSSAEEMQAKYGNYKLPEINRQYKEWRQEIVDGDTLEKHRILTSIRNERDLEKEVFYHQEVFDDLFSLQETMDSVYLKRLGMYQNKPSLDYNFVAKRVDQFKQHYPKVDIDQLEWEIGFYVDREGTKKKINDRKMQYRREFDSLQARNDAQRQAIQPKSDSVSIVETYGNYNEYLLQRSMGFKSSHGHLCMFTNMNYKWMANLIAWLTQQNWNMGDEKITANTATAKLSGNCNNCREENPRITLTSFFDPKTKLTNTLTITGSTGMLDNIFLFYWENSQYKIDYKKAEATFYYESFTDKVIYTRKLQGSTIKVVKNTNIHYDPRKPENQQSR